MHRSPVMNVLQRQVLSHQSRTPTVNKLIAPPCDVFINHRGIDTKRTVASLLYDHLVGLNLRPFLDSKNMKPGDKLFEKINSGIQGCKIGVTIFSPRYCDSYFCLHELAMIVESKKKVIPIFCDVKPSELRVVDDGSVSPLEMQRFSAALEEAKYTVGVTFNSLNGNWADVVTNVAEVVIDSLIEVEEDQN
ncbi:Toll-Interleukin-Resistance (TIR) domain family protein [Actinidia rufa]|uniref:Toll-Interleukin-Resistance (TIR) domain family protein n=1 Tax=Actinidia rufa TaxID=165716 RepID=A0A7J0GXC3_9ERIC|nr:Toll-Interleukin-Resistance (TIR) domain family protein [Actinidia rufa]